MKIELENNFGRERTFNTIIPKIKDWNYSDLHGKGLYSNINRFAFVELKFSVNNSKYSNSNLLWNEELIPLKFSETVISTLNFFISLVRVLKNEDVSFNIELIDGGYHPIDSSNLSYEIATIRAILNCFQSSDKIISQSDITRIHSYQIAYENYKKNRNNGM